MNKLNRLTSPSFIIGLVLSTGLILLAASLFLYIVPHYKIDGTSEYTTWSFLTAHPWLVIAGCIVAGALTLLGDQYYRTVTTSHRAILTGLQAIITPIVVMIVLLKIAPGKAIDPDIPAIQDHLFGEHGTFLKEADIVSLYSTHIDPYQSEEGVPEPELFHGFEVYGSTEIKDPETIQAIHSNLQSRIHWNKDMVVTICCFWPRHGLRAYRGDEIRDYLICFQCAKLYIYETPSAEEYDFIALESGIRGEDTTNHLLNGILDEAKIERDRSNCE